MNEENPATVAAFGWQRLSPVSIIYFILKFTGSAAKQWFTNALPALAAFTVFIENKLFWISILLPVLLLMILLYGFLYYWFFRFQTKNGEILIHRGVFNKEHLNLRYSRVQNVNIGRPFYFSPFKLVNCIIESAGSKASEVDLPGVSEAFATSMRSDVFSAERENESESETLEALSSDKQGSKDSSQPILKLSNWESAKSGLTSYFALIVLAAIAPFAEKYGKLVSETVFPFLLEFVKPYVGEGIFAGVLISIAIAVTVFVVLTAASVIGALIRYYNFELYDNEEKLVRVAGLLERNSTTLTKAKVQSIVFNQNLIAKFLNRASIQYRQVGIKVPNKDDASIQIPMLPPKDANKYTRVVFPECKAPNFSKIHPSFVSRILLYYWCAPLLAMASIFAAFLSKFFLLSLLVLAPVYVLLKLSYHRYGFWFDDNYAAIRSGLFGHRIVVFPLYKVQMTSVRQSRGQRKRKVGNLRVQLGSGIESIPYVPMEQLNKFMNLALYKTQSSTKPWM